VDTRIRDLENKCGEMQRTLEKKKAVVGELRGQLAKVADDLAEAEAEELRVTTKLAELEGEKVEAYNRRAQEAAEVAQMVLPVLPRQITGTLDGLWKQLGPAHFEQAGCPVEKVPDITAMLSKLVAMALQLQAAPPGADGSTKGVTAPAAAAGATASDPKPAAAVATVAAAAAQQAAGLSAGELEDPLEDQDDEEMCDEDLAAIAPQAGAGEIAALRARLKESGLWVRNSRRKHKAEAGKK
jgi:hypothetical protein